MRYLEGPNSRKQSRMVVAKDLGNGGMRNCCLMDIQFQFCKIQRVLEMGGGDDHKTV